jgi:hypothetical protein
MKPDLPPYELYTGQTGGFLAVEYKDEVLALPLYSLSRMVLRGQDTAQQLMCEFAAVQVVAHGQGLREVMEQMMLGRVRLNAGSLTNQHAHAYFQFLPEITSIESYPPGINTYFFEAIDGKAFDYIIPPAQRFWIIYVKLPGMFFLASLLNLNQIFSSSSGRINGQEILDAGTFDSRAPSGSLHMLLDDVFHENALAIQANYQGMPEERLRRNMEKIMKTPNKEQFRAHRTYELDMKLFLKLRDNPSC